MNHSNDSRHKTRSHSIRQKILTFVIAIILPIWLLLAFHNSYAIRIIKNQVIESYESTLRLYMNNVDNSLTAIERYFYSLMAHDIRVQTMSQTNSKDIYTFQKQTLFRDFFYNCDLLNAVNAIFLYSPSMDDFMRIDTSSGLSFAENKAVQRFVEETYSDNNADLFRFSDWNCASLEGRNYILRIIPNGNTYIGAYVSTDKLLRIITATDNDANGISLLLDGSNVPITSRQELEDLGITLEEGLENVGAPYIPVMQDSSVGGFRLVKLLYSNALLEHLPILREIIYWLSLVLVVLLALSLLYLRKIIITPLMLINQTTAKIGQGVLDTRIPITRSSIEFECLNESFNDMLDRLQEYKIEIYEETLSRQKAELQYLHLQINPHFFLNALNMIFTLARSKKYEMIQQMTYSLIEYFRFLLRDSFSMVTVADELRLIDHYIRIQTFRYPDALALSVQTPEMLRTAQIPLLTIYTFVENAVKYSMPQEGRLEIDVDIRREGGQICICVSDNGTGFDPDILFTLQCGDKVVDERGEEHIGIWNISQRLKLLYGDQADIFIDNRLPRGAIIQITIPDSQTGE